jgi:hypothetical protein
MVAASRVFVLVGKECMQRKQILRAFAWLCVGSMIVPAGAWSNRGHRMVNLVAAESLPKDMPAFMRTPQAIVEISYLGPEPDRWRPETEPELSNVHGPNHVFRMELGELVSPLPRRRTEFVSKLEAMRAAHPGTEDNTLRAERIGTLPWQAEEVYERLQSAFRSYRIASGDIAESAWPDEAPIKPDDLPAIEASALYYAGELGHYIGDGSMPLHDTVNLAGWVSKDNPNGYTTRSGIHHQLELVADAAIEQRAITEKEILPLMSAPKELADPFAATLSYLQTEGQYAEAVYKAEKTGALEKSGTPEFDRFIAQRFAEGGSMLRDMIYTAWLHSKETRSPAYPPTISIPFTPHP